MAKKEEELRQRPVIGTGLSGVDSFFSRPLASTIGDAGRTVGSGLASAATGISSAVTPSLVAARDFVSGIRSPFDGMALIGRRDPAPLQFPADRPDPLRQDPVGGAVGFQPRTTNSSSMSVADSIAQSNANMTDNQRRAYGLLSLSPSSAGVAMGAYQGAPTGIAGGVAPTTFSPSFYQGIASSRFGLAQSPNQTPMAPVTTNIAGATERRGVQTAYGMIYPAAGQEAGAERSAALGPMGARLANVGQELSQQDRIAQMRTRGAEIGRRRIAGMEEFFTDKRAERKLANSLGLDGNSTYYKSQPSSIAGIQRDYANYQGAGFGKMTNFVQDMIREESKSGPSRPIPMPVGNSRPIPMPVFNPSGQMIGVTPDFGGGTASGRIGAPDFGTRSGMDVPSPYPSGDESRANRAKRRAQIQGIDPSGYNPVLPRELQGV